MFGQKRSTRLFFGICGVFFGLLTFMQAAHGEKNAEKIRIGYYENEIFQEGAAPGAVRNGYAYEYYRKLSEYTGWQYEYVYGSYAELYRMLLEGKVDLLAGLAKTEARLGIIGYPQMPMGSESYNVIKHRNDESITVSPSTISGKRVGVLSGAMVAALNKFLAEHNLNADVVEYESNQELLSAFTENDIDAMVAESEGTYDREYVDFLYTIGAAEYYSCVNIRRPDILAELNEAQEQMAVAEPNFVNSLRMKYYPSTLSSRSLSASEKDWIKQHNTLKVGYIDNYLPYSDKDRNGAATGVVRELIPLMLEKLNLSYITVSYVDFENYDDMIAAVNADEIDVAFPVGGGLFFSEENGIYQSVPVISTNSELVFKGEFNEQKEPRFAVNENNRMQYYYIRANFPNAEFVNYSSIEECLDAVAKGKVTYTTLNGMRADSMVKKRRYRELSLKQIHRYDDQSFGVKIGNEGLLKLINRSLNIIGKDRAENIAYQYVDKIYTRTPLDKILDNLWLVACAAAFLILMIIVFLLRESANTKSRMREKEAAQKELEEKNWELANNRRELIAANAKLSANAQEAKDANKAKSAFLSTMSHEIRTPINAVLGMNELILRESREPETLKYARNISGAGQALLALINDILDFSKIESGRMELVSAAYQLSSLLHDTVTIIEPRAAKKKLLFNARIDGNLPSELMGDAVRIRQIMLNILTNAVKYTPQGKIDFIVKPSSIDDDNLILEIEVTDTGIGIKEEDRQRLFADFERLDSLKNSNVEGTGLGLAITRRLIELMNGTVEVESVYGQGSTFRVRLPQKIVNSTPIGDFNEQITSETDRNVYRVDFVAPEAKVLLVDDNEMNLMVAQGLLKETQVSVTVCNSGQECLDRMSAEHYDVIFLDQMMPEMDGVETFRRSLSLENNKCRNTPVIALTANAVQGAKEMFLSEGFVDYLSKPVSGRKLEQMLKKYLPAEKISTADDNRGEIATTIDAPAPPDKTPDGTTDATPLVDRAMGLEYSGGMTELYDELIAVFCKLKDTKKAELEQEFAAQDWQNYTIHVHALKSTAKTIGCMPLSEAARALEMAGRVLRSREAADDERAEQLKFINDNHAPAMKLYDETAEAVSLMRE